MRYCHLWILVFCASLCGLPGANAQNTSWTVKGSDAAVRYVGRTQVQEDGSVTFDWVGTYLETRFAGGKLSIRLSETGTSYYNVFVDGKLHTVVKACGTDTVLTSFLE